MENSFVALNLEQGEKSVNLKLSRPESRNSIDQQMVDELHQVCSHLERDPQILTISGEGGVFASGADIRQLRERRRAEALRGINNSIFDRISRLPMPVIAVIDGYALGGGLELALAADFRIATDRAKLGQPETGLGIMAAAGGTWRLQNAVGQSLAREMLLSGRILTGAEAFEHGLVNRVAEPDALEEETAALVDAISAQDPLAVRISKLVMAMPESAHPEVDNLAQAILFESEGKFERMQKFLDKKGKK